MPERRNPAQDVHRTVTEMEERLAKKEKEKRTHETRNQTQRVFETARQLSESKSGERLEREQGGRAPDQKDDHVPSPGRGGEIGGPQGPEPTRFGDWERKGRCSDF